MSERAVKSILLVLLIAVTIASILHSIMIPMTVHESEIEQISNVG